jgi:hypothetical protein
MVAPGESPGFGVQENSALKGRGKFRRPRLGRPREVEWWHVLWDAAKTLKAQVERIKPLKVA